MNFYSIEDLKTNSEKFWLDLRNEDEVVLTNNGKPSALLTGIPDECFEKTVQVVRQAKTIIALNNMHSRAAKEGYMTDEEINSLIDEARKDR